MISVVREIVLEDGEIKRSVRMLKHKFVYYEYGPRDSKMGMIRCSRCLREEMVSLIDSDDGVTFPTLSMTNPCDYLEYAIYAGGEKYILNARKRVENIQ